MDTYSPTDKHDSGKREVHVGKNVFITKDDAKLTISSKDTKYMAGTSVELVEQEKTDKETDTYKIDVQFSATGEAGKAVESSDKRVVNALDRTGDSMTGDLNMGTHLIRTDSLKTASDIDQSPADLIIYSDTIDGRAVSVGNTKATTNITSKDKVHIEAPLEMGNRPVGGLADPIETRDATHKGYVDAEISTAVADMEAYTDKYTYYIKDDSVEKVDHNANNQYIFDIYHKSNKTDVQEAFEALTNIKVTDNINQEMLSYNPYSTSDQKIKVNDNLKVTQNDNSITIDAVDHIYHPGIGLSKEDSQVNNTTYNSTFNLKAATDNELGGIKTGYATDNAGRQYAVQLDASKKGYVNIPWTDTLYDHDSDHPNSTGIDANKIYTIFKLDKKGHVVYAEEPSAKKLSNYGITDAVEKKQTIAGLGLAGNISAADLTAALIVASESAKGLMSETDKINLDNLMNILTGGESAPSTLVKTLQDVLHHP